MSPPMYGSALESFLNYNDIQFEITMKDVQAAIDKETKRSYSRNSRSMSWDTYYTLEDIEAWMSDMAAAYPDVVTEIVGGETYEGRHIKGLKISHGEAKKTVFIESGIHSREWITMTAATYIINQLLTSEDPDTMAAAREFDWYIFPVANPDGYAWTHSNDRMWRKNRRPVGNNQIGVDLNRNWNNNWLVAGASTNPASDSYAGPGPFSEPETRSLSEYIRSVENIELYLSFHSFSQLLLIPFGNSTEPVANYHDALNIGRRAMGALSVRYGTQYVTGNIAEAIYLATGGSVDWVKEHLKVPLVYCYEFRDRGEFGQILPADQILPNAEEVWDSILEMIHQAKRFGYLNSGNGLKGTVMAVVLMAFAVVNL
ncbi:zinc carboxypeptidase domain-containing protein [Phthorimaea operculella]|nr:zinc carboxypeptidase domain-containing protein [Phthorimaea operculella]